MVVDNQMVIDWHTETCCTYWIGQISYQRSDL